MMQLHDLKDKPINIPPAYSYNLYLDVKKIKKFALRIPFEYRYVLLLFVTTRSILTVIGVIFRIMLEPFHGKEYVWIYSKYLFLDIWGVWDSGWYLSIVKNGYLVDQSIRSETFGQANYAFFPLYPLLIRVFSFITSDPFISGIIVSNICLFLSGIVLYKLVIRENGNDVAERTVKYLFFFPTSFVLSSVYSESLYLLLVLLCFYFAIRKEWFQSSIVGLFASLIRLVGILLLIPFCFEFFNKKTKGRSVLKFLFGALIPLGVVSFCTYNYLLTRNPFSFISIESSWGRVLSNPISVLFNGIESQDIVIMFSAYFSLIFVILLVNIYVKKLLAPSFFVWSLFSFLLPLSTGVFGIPRYVVVIFPFYIAFAIIGKNKLKDEVFSMTFLLLQGFLMVTWANGFSIVQ